MLYECLRGHRSATPGTCYQDGCYGRFKPVEDKSTRSVARRVSDELSTLNLVNYIDRARRHFYKEGPKEDEY
jgi:hypothetical protein